MPIRTLLCLLWMGVLITDSSITLAKVTPSQAKLCANSVSWPWGREVDDELNKIQQGLLQTDDLTHVRAIQTYYDVYHEHIEPLEHHQQVVYFMKGLDILPLQGGELTYFAQIVAQQSENASLFVHVMNRQIDAMEGVIHYAAKRQLYLDARNTVMVLMENHASTPSPKRNKPALASKACD